MQNDMIKSLRIYLNRNVADEMSDDDRIAKADEVLKGIIDSAADDYDSKQYAEMKSTIESFMTESDSKRNKLLSFCEDFNDPTTVGQAVCDSCESIELHKLLQEDDLMKLYHFVLRHADDITFGKTVERIKKEHGMESPQVYENAMMRRQDFSRAASFKCKNVSRRIAWQIIIGLHCNIDEADELLFSAGYMRRKSSLDLAMEYFIERKNYDILAINEVLYQLGLKPFSCYIPVKDKDTQ